MAGQLSITELAVIVTLGAAVGVPMQAPERGILPSVIILAIVLAFQRGTSFWAFKGARIELLTHGNLVCLVRDGRLLLDQMGRVGISRERLFAVLRGQCVEQLGEVRRVYLEGVACGACIPCPNRSPD